MTFVAAVPLVELAVMIAIVAAIFLFSASAPVALAIVLLVTLRLPVSVFFITAVTIMVGKSCVLPQAQKQCHACNQ